MLGPQLLLLLILANGLNEGIHGQSVRCGDGRVCQKQLAYRDPCLVYLCPLCGWGKPGCDYEVEPTSNDCEVAICHKEPTPHPPHQPSRWYVWVGVVAGVLLAAGIPLWKGRGRISQWWVQRRRTESPTGEETMPPVEEADEAQEVSESGQEEEQRLLLSWWERVQNFWRHEDEEEREESQPLLAGLVSRFCPDRREPDYEELVVWRRGEAGEDPVVSDAPATLSLGT